MFPTAVVRQAKGPYHYAVCTQTVEGQLEAKTTKLQDQESDDPTCVASLFSYSFQSQNPEQKNCVRCTFRRAAVAVAAGVCLVAWVPKLVHVLSTVFRGLAFNIRVSEKSNTRAPRTRLPLSCHDSYLDSYPDRSSWLGLWEFGNPASESPSPIEPPSSSATSGPISLPTQAVSSPSQGSARLLLLLEETLPRPGAELACMNEHGSVSRIC